MDKINNLEDLYSYMEERDFNIKLRSNFDKFTNVVLRRLYNKVVHNGSGLDTIDEDLFDIDLVVEYLKLTDEKCLDDPEFSKVILGDKKEVVKQLGSSEEKITKTYNYATVYGEVALGIAYIPGKNELRPNRVRIDICEALNQGKAYINGSIDILSDNRVQMGDFDEMVYRKINNDVTCKEFKSSIEKTSIDSDALDELKELMSYIFELANLKTKPKQKMKR